MSQLIAMHYYVSGHVQGVFFRASTRSAAESLGLTGWVRNLPDGRVEVMAAGEPLQLEQLHRFLQQGPPRAVVSDVVGESVPWQDFDGFQAL